MTCRSNACPCGVDLRLFIGRAVVYIAGAAHVGLRGVGAGRGGLFVTRAVCWGHDVRTVWREGRGAGEAGATGSVLLERVQAAGVPRAAFWGACVHA